jgi:hypothetical protein
MNFHLCLPNSRSIAFEKVTFLLLFAERNPVGTKTCQAELQNLSHQLQFEYAIAHRRPIT